MLLLQHIAYAHPGKDLLFRNVDLAVSRHDKIALIGNNGTGKSTLLRIMAGELQPAAGTVKTGASPYYIPQIFGQYNEYTIAQALQVAGKLQALKAILDGRVTDGNLALLDDDWTIEERCREALSHWRLHDLDLSRKMGTLSGGQKTAVFLSGISIHQPQLVLLDEPSNHLDSAGRSLLYSYIQSTAHTLVVVSHDRTLLNLLGTVCELSKEGITRYGGSYDFYAAQKALGEAALAEDLRSREKALRKAKEVERESLERQQKLDARGRKKQEKAGLPTISMNTLRNNAEKSTSRTKEVHAEKVASVSASVQELRRELPDNDGMKIGFDNSALHRGKILIHAQGINYSYGTQPLWQQPLHLQITSGRRIALKGANGSGKTTLIKMLLGVLQPQSGTLYRAEGIRAIYLDQDYSLVSDQHTVYGQAQQFNTGHLQEHEVKSHLTRFLFTGTGWDKPCAALSGGEKMRLILCCLTISAKAPDIIILDEPTNNLDIQNIELLTAAVNEYTGTLIVVSHDAYFLEQIGAGEVIGLL